MENFQHPGRSSQRKTVALEIIQERQFRVRNASMHSLENSESREKSQQVTLRLLIDLICSDIN